MIDNKKNKSIEHEYISGLKVRFNILDRIKIFGIWVKIIKREEKRRGIKLWCNGWIHGTKFRNERIIGGIYVIE